MLRLLLQIYQAMYFSALETTEDEKNGEGDFSLPTT